MCWKTNLHVFTSKIGPLPILQEFPSSAPVQTLNYGIIDIGCNSSFSTGASVQCAVCQCAVYQCAVCSVQCVSVQCASVQCAVCSVQCAVCQCAVCSVPVCSACFLADSLTQAAQLTSKYLLAVWTEHAEK